MTFAIRLLGYLSNLLHHESLVRTEKYFAVEIVAINNFLQMSIIASASSTLQHVYPLDSFKV